MPVCTACHKEFPPEDFSTKKGVQKYYRCPRCRQESAKKRMKRRYTHDPVATRQRLIEAMGSKCAHCGYSHFPESLEFHQIGYSTSNIPMLINRFTYYPTPKLWATILRNLHRSTLLCKSCRYALRLGLWDDSRLKPSEGDIEMPRAA